MSRLSDIRPLRSFALAGVLALSATASCRRESGVTPAASAVGPADPVAATAAAPAASTALAAPAAPAGVLAVVDGRPVTEATFRHWWENRRPAADTPEVRAGVLSRLIERSALAQAARQAGLDQDPVLAEQIEALLIARLRETRWQPHLDALTVTEAEVRAAYEARSGEAFGQPESTRVAVLWFNTRGQAPLVARYRPRLEEIRRQILSDPAAFPVASGFGELAAGNTEHAASRLKGGDLGWLDSGPSTDPWRVAVLETAASLQQPGDLSEVTANASGLFLVRVIERRAARVQSFDEAKPRLERSLLEQRRIEAGQQLMSDIVAAASVQRFDERLSALAPLPPPAAPQPVPAFPNP